MKVESNEIGCIGHHGNVILVVSGLCAACMLARVEQERLESLKYDRATIYIKCIDENGETKAENDSEVMSFYRRIFIKCRICCTTLSLR